VRHANGEPLDESAVTFRVYLDDWLQNAVKSRVRRRTYDDYVYAVDHWIKPVLGKLALTEVKPLDLQKLYNDLLEQGLSARTVELVHTLLYNAFDQAIQWEKLASNPAMRVKAPKKQKSKAAALTAAAGQVSLPGAGKAGHPAQNHVARHAAHDGDDADGHERQSEDRQRADGSQFSQDHARHLQSRTTWHAARGDRPDGKSSGWLKIGFLSRFFGVVTLLAHKASATEGNKCRQAL